MAVQERVRRVVAVRHLHRRRVELDRLLRLERKVAELRSQSQGLDALAGLCGWRTSNALRTAFLKRYGMSMRTWRDSRRHAISNQL